MNSLLEILQPDFLLRDALVSSVVIGLVAPLVGVYFVLRRMIFLGVALPQVSAAGIAFAFLAYRLGIGFHEHGGTSEQALAFGGSLGFTLLTLFVLSVLESKNRITAEGRVGATYAVAAAATILFLAADPQGEAEMVNILKGDMLAATNSSLALNLAVFLSVAATLITFKKQLLLVSFDRDLAVVFGMRAAAWDLLLYLCIGATISVGVMSAGPIVIFGFLVIPPLTARIVCKHMLTFFLVSSILGGCTAFAGFYLAYVFDLPLGPAEVALGGAILLVLSSADMLKRTRRATA